MKNIIGGKSPRTLFRYYFFQANGKVYLQCPCVPYSFFTSSFDFFFCQISRLIIALKRYFEPTEHVCKLLVELARDI